MIIVLQDGMEWVRSSSLDALFIKINFDKSYDKFEWILFGPIRSIGFGAYFIHSVETIFVDSSSQ